MMTSLGIDMDSGLPPIIIARGDYARLERLAADAVTARHPVGGFLMSEIRRSAVLDTNKMPGGVARINGRVTYRVDGSGQCESKILIYPDDLRNDQTGLSVLSPLGAAVLGLSIGHRMKFFSIEGGFHSVIVEDVAPTGELLRFPLEARSKGCQLFSDFRGPDDDGPEAA